MAVLGKELLVIIPDFESVKLNKVDYWVGYLTADFILGLRVSGFAESSGVKGLLKATEPIFLMFKFSMLSGSE